MSKDKKQKGLFAAVIVSALILLAAVIWAAMKHSEPQASMAPDHHNDHETAHPHEHDTNILSKDTNQSKENQSDSSQPTIEDVLKMAEQSWSWGAYYNDWFGKKAPDFTLTDINGKTHSLSDYKGKEVMLVFWATWCGPCKIEIPHLIELRKTISEDKLAILAVSNEREELVKNFAENNNLNYNVLVSKSVLPKPYSLVTGIPSSFFIDPEGNIKFGTMGTIDFEVMKAIVAAK